MSAQKNVEQSSTVWKQAPQSTSFSWIHRLSSPDLASGMCSKQLSSKPVRSIRPTTLKCNIFWMYTIDTRSLWSYSYILWKVVYRNTRCMCALRPRNTFVLSSRFLLSPPKLPTRLHSSLRRSYVTWSFGRALMGTLFGRQIVLSMRQNNGHGELTRR